MAQGVSESSRPAEPPLGSARAWTFPIQALATRLITLPIPYRVSIASSATVKPLEAGFFWPLGATVMVWVPADRT